MIRRERIARRTFGCLLGIAVLLAVILCLAVIVGTVAP